MTTATATLTPATPAQIREVQRLIVRLEVLGQDMIDTRKRLNDCWAVNQLDDVMLTLATEVLTKRITNLETAPDRRAVPTGRYAVLTEAGHYAFYRVWVGDRATLVFLITSDEETRCPRQTAPAILSKILAYGVLEASKAYGREIGVCGVCNRTLTDPDSIALGIGPVCATRL